MLPHARMRALRHTARDARGIVTPTGYRVVRDARVEGNTHV